jgi:undecaprenyl-diphosphatase
LLLAGACVAFIYGFTRFASEVMERETLTFDHAIREWSMSHRNAALDNFFSAVTWLGDWRVLILAALVTGWFLVRRGARKRPLLLATAPFACSLIINLLKRWYRVERPPGGLTAAFTFSFPSGHTSASTAISFVLAYTLIRESMAPRGAVMLMALVPFLVGLSRIYLDMHWASDVIGGWVIGAAYGVAVCAIYEAARRRSEQRPTA